MGYKGVPYKLMAFPIASLVMIMYFFFSGGSQSDSSVWKEENEKHKEELEAMKQDLVKSKQMMEEMQREIDRLQNANGDQGHKAEHKTHEEKPGRHATDDFDKDETCYYLTGNGVGDRNNMGMYVKTDHTINGSPAFQRRRGAWTREERWLCALPDRRWILTDTLTNCQAGHATWVSKLASEDGHPTKLEPWSTLVGESWVEIADFRVIYKTRVQCELSKELHGKIPHNGDSHPQAHVNYEADYDVNDLKTDPERYSYKSARDFKYLEDRDVEKPPFTILSNIPKIYFFDRLLSDEECDAIVHAAEHKITRSGVVPHKGTNGSSIQNVRTSSHTWLSEENSVVNDVMHRILSLFGFGVADHEALQVLRYQHNQKYDAHHDFFDPVFYGKQVSNRALTCFLYLNTVEEGGETWFPRANGGSGSGDFTSCKRGLRTKPVKGSAACFYDMRPDYTLDEYSLHGGCPVTKGTKWGGTLWMHVDVEESEEEDTTA